MANAYLVGIYNKIIDQEKLQKYALDALPAMMANGGKKALARSANITQIEGIPPERAVILEFSVCYRRSLITKDQMPFQTIFSLN
jgi:uncharacterized protein (DUF1330 family)